jgi:hypothetical protein
MALKMKICVLLLVLMVASFEVDGRDLFKRSEFFFSFPVFFFFSCPELVHLYHMAKVIIQIAWGSTQWRRQGGDGWVLSRPSSLFNNRI